MQSVDFSDTFISRNWPMPLSSIQVLSEDYPGINQYLDGRSHKSQVELVW